MECFFCKQHIEEKDYKQINISYSYDVRGSHFADTQTYPEYLQDSHKECWNTHWKEMSKFYDDVDEVMNRNIYFQREKGMIGKYTDGDKEFSPVYAYWKSANIDGSFICEPLGEERGALHKFRGWLKENNLVYKYKSR